MKPFLHIVALAVLAIFAATEAYAADAVDADRLTRKGDVVDADKLAKKGEVPERVLGSLSAPIKVDEYVSLTCPHCAEFYTTTLPQLEKEYVDTGKVRFVFHDFVMDAPGLKAAIIARCMPESEFFPFIRVLYSNQREWAFNMSPDNILISYAKLGGLSDEKARACLSDTQLQDAIIAERTAVESRITATPTFIINDSPQTINGALPVADFEKTFDNLLASKH